MQQGGLGAPLVPEFHKYLFAESNKRKVIFNIGGISNGTYLDGEDIGVASDVGPGNCLIDLVAMRDFGIPYDEDGKIAATGQIDKQLLNSLLDKILTKGYPRADDKTFYYNLDELKSDKPENLLATLSGQRYTAQRYFDDELGKQYFDENGNNVKKAFLRAPLDFAYISSHFNPNRMHPILHKIKAHNGVDYAARRNTPIKASGEGVISFAGWKSGYGRTLEIRHGGNISTLYAHLEKFESKIKVGTKVSQGQIIAFVGDSGLATAPHLHYEFRIGDKRTDPVKVELPSAKPIDKSKLGSFKAIVQESKETLKVFDLESNEVAYE
jgi:murein DD-endopeptidase MepM/ murein hydrolase activator NlpD